MAEPVASQRMSKLQAMLQKQPNDTFLLYGLAMEYKKAGDPARAVEHFDRVISLDPGYCYAYHQKGQTYEASGNREAARQAYRDGIAAATAKGDQHAREEITAALEMLS